MKKRLIAFALALVLSGLALSGAGCYYKYLVLRPYGLAQDQFAPAVPILLLTDQDGLREQLRQAQDQATAPTTEPTTAPTTVPTTVPTEPVTEPTTEATTEPVTEPPTEPPAEPPTEPTTPPPVTDGKVDESWFDDVLFVGDSRTAGMRLYSRLGQADYFSSTGMTVFNWQKAEVEDLHFPKESLEALLGSKTYGKIFLCLGINECGDDHDEILRAYGELVNVLREKQPEAQIFLVSVMTVGRSKVQDGWYFTPENIADLNGRIAQLAADEDLFYLDSNTRFADENGYLPDNISADGCHLYAEDYPAYTDWLREAVADLLFS